MRQKMLKNVLESLVSPMARHLELYTGGWSLSRRSRRGELGHELPFAWRFSVPRGEFAGAQQRSLAGVQSHAGAR